MAHAILSASGAKRWMSCTPSARLEQQFEEQTSSFAEEGTFAHALADLKLSRAITNTVRPSVYKKRLAEMQKHPLYSTGLEDYVDQYVAQVGERFIAAKDKCPDTLVLLEQRLGFSLWVPEGFGTGDVVIISDEAIEVIDLKYGKGVPVSAINNPQTRLYGLGALNTFETLYDFEKVRTTIIQPRLDSTSTEELTVDDLIKWAESEVMPKAILAHAGEGLFCAGEHCKFCKAKYNCRARATANLEMAKYDFEDPALLSNDEIADILARADQLKSWVTDIHGFALDQAENHGIQFPGWKLVEGRSNRKYTEEETVGQVLTQAGYLEEQILKPAELLGITAMEKAIGTKEFGTLLSDLVIKPAGKPVLVPKADKRPELNSLQAAKDDFKD